MPICDHCKEAYHTLFGHECKMRIICLNCGGSGRQTINDESYSCYYCQGLGYHTKETNQMKTTMTRRFYKTHSAIQRPSILGLYSEAQSSAVADVESGKYEECYIVEVVAIVKRQKPVVNPIVVEMVERG